MSDLALEALVSFDKNQIILENIEEFKITLSDSVDNLKVSLIIDVYSLEDQRHPEGHIGWWKFELNENINELEGKLKLNEGSFGCELLGCALLDSWQNPKKINTVSYIVNAVLRSDLTNAAVYIDKIPCFEYEADANFYRSQYNRKLNEPLYEFGTTLIDPNLNVRIVCPDVYVKDAVGNFCLDTHKLFRQQNISSSIYAKEFDLSLNDFIQKIERLENDFGENEVLFYFASTFFPELDKVLSLPFKHRIVYYHGITDPELLMVFEPATANWMKKGRAQNKLLSKFDTLVANSRTSARELEQSFDSDYTFDDKNFAIIPPVLLPLEKKKISIVEKEDGKNEIKILVVGRVQTNKKIEDVLQFFSEFLLIEPEASLTIIGFSNDGAYQNYLDWLANESLKIPADRIKWNSNLDGDELVREYQSSSILLNMSEHEGFAVTIFEAMRYGLPVFSFAQATILEIYEDSCIYFYEKNYKMVAGAVKRFLAHPQNLKVQKAKQMEQVEKLILRMSGKELINLLQIKI